MKPEKVTFETITRHLPEDYFDQWVYPEEVRALLEKRIIKANKPVGGKSAAVMNRRSMKLQELYVSLKSLTASEARQFEALCEELSRAKAIVGICNRENKFAKIAEKYALFSELKLLRVYRQFNGSVYDCEMQSAALDFCRSLKSYYSYSELL